MLDLKGRPPIILALCLAWGASASALDRDEARDRLKEAREQYADMINLKEVYHTKRALVAGINQGLVFRREVGALVSYLKIQVDGLPGRRNNLQQGIYNDWLAARQQLTEIDRQIEMAHAGMREVDEAILDRAQRLRKPPSQVNRFDILAAFPEVERRCGEAFDRLRSSVNDAGGQSEVDRVLRELNGDLNRSGEGDGRYGALGPFLAEFRNFKRSSGTPALAPGKGSGKARKLAGR